MDKHVEYRTRGVCASTIRFDIVNGYVHNVSFEGGCRGNAQGVARLAEGRKAQEVINVLKGIECHDGNSCPHQLALALEQEL